jgi:hypothetical protein
MFNKWQDIDLSWAYLTEEMKPSEKSAFEARLLLDKKLEKVFEEQKNIFESLQKSKHIDFRRKLSIIIKSNRVKNQSNARKNRRTWMLAAAFVLILMTIAFFSYMNYYSDFDDITDCYALYYKDKCGQINEDSIKEYAKFLLSAVSENSGKIIQSHEGLVENYGSLRKKWPEHTDMLLFSPKLIGKALYNKPPDYIVPKSFMVFSIRDISQQGFYSFSLYNDKGFLLLQQNVESGLFMVNADFPKGNYIWFLQADNHCAGMGVCNII